MNRSVEGTRDQVIDQEHHRSLFLKGKKIFPVHEFWHFILLKKALKVLIVNCSQTKFVAIILVLSVFLCDFLLDRFLV